MDRRIAALRRLRHGRGRAPRGQDGPGQSGGAKVVELGDPDLVAAAVEGRPQPGVERRPGALGAGEPLADAKHVGVVVGPGKAGGGHVVGHRGPHARHLVGGHGDAVAAAAYAHSQVGVTFGHGPAHRRAEVGIVHPVGGMGAAVGHVVAGCQQMPSQGLLQLVAGMVGPHRDPHGRHPKSEREQVKAPRVAAVSCGGHLRRDLRAAQYQQTLPTASLHFSPRLSRIAPYSLGL